MGDRRQSREDIVDLYRRVWAHSDETIDRLGLDAIGRCPWWPAERSEVTLHRVLVHMIAETDRHAGQADIVRELIDGAVGLRPDADNMPPGDQAWWEGYRQQLEDVARQASSRLRDRYPAALAAWCYGATWAAGRAPDGWARWRARPARRGPDQSAGTASTASATA